MKLNEIIKHGLTELDGILSYNGFAVLKIWIPITDNDMRIVKEFLYH